MRLNKSIEAQLARIEAKINQAVAEQRQPEEPGEDDHYHRLVTVARAAGLTEEELANLMRGFVLLPAGSPERAQAFRRFADALRTGADALNREWLNRERLNRGRL